MPFFIDVLRQLLSFTAERRLRNTCRSVRGDARMMAEFMEASQGWQLKFLALQGLHDRQAHLKPNLYPFSTITGSNDDN